MFTLVGNPIITTSTTSVRGSEQESTQVLNRLLVQAAVTLLRAAGRWRLQMLITDLRHYQAVALTIFLFHVRSLATLRFCKERANQETLTERQEEGCLSSDSAADI